MFESWLADPVLGVEEVIVLGVLILVLLLVWRYRDRVLVVLTGDDRIHGTGLDFVWWFFFRCCGMCTGDWTRCLTRSCLCPCKRIRGQNLVNVVGRYLGLTHYTVELKNIVVGDLPWTGPGDFFLQVECEANPPINSSLAQSKEPKVVHFPELVTLHLRWSHFEQQVRITVRELGLLGSTEVCSVRFRACDVVDWSHSDIPERRTKRVEMKLADWTHTLGVHHVLTTPWIHLEFDQPTEYRDLGTFNHGNPSVVRTGTRTGYYEDRSVSQFKHSYALLDGNGNHMPEPLEEDLEGIHRCRQCVVCMTSFCTAMVSIVVVVYLALRGYVYSCDKRYKWLAMAALLHKKFPISNHDVFAMVEQCEEKLDGTGTPDGTNPCRPTDDQVASVCLEHFPEGQPRPTAFDAHLERWLGFKVHGVPCSPRLCEHFDSVRETDVLCMCGCVVLVILALICRYQGKDLFDKFKSSTMRERSLQMFENFEGPPEE